MEMFDTGYSSTTNPPNNLTCSFSRSCPQPVIGSRGGYPYVQYQKDSGIATGYFWHYGEAITLQFDIDGQLTDDDAQTYTTVQQYAESFPKVLTISDFRGRVIIEQVIPAESATSYTLTVDQALLLLPGTYKLSLHLLLQGGARLVLIAAEDCNITVL